jgi:regulator of replication initiation timing
MEFKEIMAGARRKNEWLKMRVEIANSQNVELYDQYENLRGKIAENFPDDEGIKKEFETLMEENKKLENTITGLEKINTDILGKIRELRKLAWELKRNTEKKAG